MIALDQFANPSVAAADVVFPIAGFAEVEGTSTNLEGRVSVLNQKVTAPGTARADWIVAAELALRLGADLGLESVAGIQSEIARLAPAYAGVDAARLAEPDAADGLVVPLPTVADPPPATEVSGDDAPAAADTAVEDSTEEGPGDGDGADDPVDAGPVAAGPAPAPAPALVTFSPGPGVQPPALDSYSLRLVVTRKLYDQGTLVQQASSLAGLAPGTILRVNPYDFDRLGVAPGAQVRVHSARAQVTVEISTDEGVPRGSASLLFNQPGLDAATLIDSAARVNDVRVESGGA